MCQIPYYEADFYKKVLFGWPEEYRSPYLPASQITTTGAGPLYIRGKHRWQCYHEAHRAVPRKANYLDGLSLQVLQTCSTIYQEACLIPFKENTFNFADLCAFAAFLQDRRPDFIAAIQTVTVYVSDLNLNAWERGSPEQEQLLENLTKLRSLRSIQIYLEYGSKCDGPVKYRRKYDPNSDGMIYRDEQDMIISMLSVVACLAPRTVRIFFNNISTSSFLPPTAELERFERGVMRALLPSSA